MTESEWMASTDPQALLRWLTYTTGGGMGDGPPLWFRSDRKLRLFACACCRQVWDKLQDPRSRRAVEAAERYADGLATEEERLRAERGMGSPELYPSVVNTAVWLAVREPLSVEDFSATIKADRVVPLAAQAALLRCVIGNPWRPVTLSCPYCAGGAVPTDRDDDTCKMCGGTNRPHCLTPAVIAVARAIYQERRPADLPILADALEEAGCDDAGLLAHLRQVGGPCPQCLGRGRYVQSLSPGYDAEKECDLCRGTGFLKGVHAIPGCWVLELLLGKD